MALQVKDIHINPRTFMDWVGYCIDIKMTMLVYAEINNEKKKKSMRR